MRRNHFLKASGIAFALFVVCPTVARAELIYGLSKNTLFTFDSQNPATVGSIRPITGLGNETLVGIDIRPETGGLYGLGSSLHLFTIDPATGVASSASGTAFGASTGSSYGFDFNPVADAARVVNNDAQNFRVSPTGSLLANDGRLAYAVGDPNFGQDPQIVAVAYGNNGPNATATSLFGIDNQSDTLVFIPAPNSGVLTTKGLLGVNTTEQVTFDVSGISGSAYASLTKPGETVSGLYRIDLDTGAASLIGSIGFAGALDGLTVASVPEPATWALLALGFGFFMASRHTRKTTSGN